MQKLIDAGVFKNWFEKDGTEMCGYFNRSAGAKETQTDSGIAKRVRLFLMP